jgi:hypothetical protein
MGWCRNECGGSLPLASEIVVVLGLQIFQYVPEKMEKEK